MSKIKSITPLKKEGKKWDLQIAGHHNYYANGLLVHNSMGDDVSLNVVTARLAPLALQEPISLEVNGEVFMDFATFERLNKALVAKGEEPYANPRNAAAGALRLHDPETCARRGLRFLAHGVIGGPWHSHSGSLASIAGMGMPIVSAASLAACAPNLHKARQCLLHVDYPTDGLVFKVDDYAWREKLGFTSRAPRWAIALKFQQEKVTTILKAITVQVGRSGVLTPCGELEPIWVDGSTVSRATLHNEDQINRLGLQIGDEVEIQKMGAIIPGIVRSITRDKREAELQEFCLAKHPEDDELGNAVTTRYYMESERPKFSLVDHIGGKCPSCGCTDIQKQVEGRATGKSIKDPKEQVAWRCMNTEGCPAQLAARILHFCSRKALNIEGIGEEMAVAIAEAMGLMNCNTPLDLMQWTVEDLMAMTWVTDSGGNMTFGESRAKKAKASLEAAKKLPLHRWLFALGIRTVGENTSKEISRLCEDINEFRYACRPPEPVKNPNGGVVYRISIREDKAAGDLAKYAVSSHLGPVSCKHLVDYCASEEGERTLYTIGEWGIKSDNYNPIPEAASESGNSMAGKTFVVTGTLSVPRPQIEALIETAGGKISGSVSKKTSFLVAGEACGSKLGKAQDLGVTILTEAELRAML